jgi:hypothetical protein
MKGEVQTIVLGLGEKGAYKEELDRLTTSLRAELLQTDVQSVRRVSHKQAPPGSKGDPLTIGWLAVTLTPIVATKVFDVLADWVKRANNRTIKVTLGQNTIELSGASREQRTKLLKKWMQEVDRGHAS